MCSLAWKEEFELRQPVRQGATAVVMNAIYKPTEQEVVVKYIKKGFIDLMDIKRALREITILR
jgi:serine/threonine protein kinase